MTDCNNCTFYIQIHRLCRLFGAQVHPKGFVDACTGKMEKLNDNTNTNEDTQQVQRNEPSNSEQRTRSEETSIRTESTKTES